MRLDKRLGAAGYTRGQAREIVRAGRVMVGGQIVRDPGAAIAPEAEVTVDGRAAEDLSVLHLMLYKPAGVVTALTDARFQTVFDCLDARLRRPNLTPVGRLDRDVTGLLLMTTDGELAHRLISPRWTVEKKYRATVEGALSEAEVIKMAAGIALSDFTARPAKLEIARAGETSEALLMVTEGKFHQVKRMFQAVGHPVISLMREEVGGVKLDGALAPGQARPLTEEEIARLKSLVRL